MNLKKRLEKAVFGADFGIKYSKMQINDGDFYIKENRKMIRKLKAKFPYTKWLGEARPYRREIEFYEKQKKDSKKELKEWKKVKALMKSQKMLKKVV